MNAAALGQLLVGLAVAIVSAVASLGQSASSSIRLYQADSLWQAGAFAKALEVVEAGLQYEHDRAEWLWRRSRLRVEQGLRASEKAQQRQWYQAALADAQAAIALDSLNSRAYVAAAIAAGRLALVSHPQAKVEHARQIKAYIDRALFLDPQNDIAYHLRGRWYYEVATLSALERAIVKVVYGGLPRASLEQAAADFRQALTLKPRVVHYLELGRTLLRLKQPEAARRALEHALALSPSEPNDSLYQAEAQALLRRLR
ncbi:hypothetical protein HRbin18_00448 [bacterium HR18]|nr:hypothetical protein HRbin18_00448 [bacterium HR18]